MLSTFIIENYALVRLAMLVGLLIAIVVAALLVRATRGRTIAAVIAGIGLAVVLGLTLTPDTYPLDAVTCNLESVTPFGDDFNIMLFLLPAIFAVVATRKPVITAASGVLLSAVIEFVQYLNPVFGRRCDIDDWLANGAGTVIGVLLAVAVIQIMKRVGRGTPPSRDVPETQTVTS